MGIYSKTEKWYVRTEDGNVFGPVEGEGLLQWAEQGRVYPGHEASRDRQAWIPIEQIDFLDMRWYVDDAEGNMRGPLNRKAAELMIANGHISSDAQICLLGDEEFPEEPQAEEEGEKFPVEESLQIPPGSDGEKTEEKEAGEPPSDASPEGIDPEKGDASEVTPAGGSEPSPDTGTGTAVEKEETGSEKQDFSLSDLEDARNEIQNLRGRLETALANLNENESKLAECTALLEGEQKRSQTLDQQLRSLEKSHAELAKHSQTHEQALNEKIEGLKKISVMSPDQLSRFYDERNAVYELVRILVDTLEGSIEEERAYFEELRQACQKRLDMMISQKQTLMRYLGSAPDEMVKRAYIQQPGDAESTRLRADLQNLRALSKQEMELAATREKELERQIKILEGENAHLKDSASEGEMLRGVVTDLKDKQEFLERQLVEERRRRDEEGRSASQTEQSLLSRIESLEREITEKKEKEKDKE